MMFANSGSANLREDRKSDFTRGVQAARRQRAASVLRLDATSWEWDRATDALSETMGDQPLAWHRGWDYAIICAREIAGHGEGAGR